MDWVKSSHVQKNRFPCTLRPTFVTINMVMDSLSTWKKATYTAKEEMATLIDIEVKHKELVSQSQATCQEGFHIFGG